MTHGITHGFSSSRLARILPTLAAHYIDTGAIPGALLMIWRRGVLAHLDMAGHTDLERGRPVREDAIYRIYSMTKPVTSVALLMLLEEGRIALDDPVSRYIPGFAGLGVFAGASNGNFVTTPPARPMQVVDLLRHTSGLTYDFHYRTPVDAAYRRMGVGALGTNGGLAAMVAQLERLPLEFSPGERWTYSVATDVAGYLVEKISGMRFGDFLRNRILQPLGMHDTDFFVASGKLDRFANCYQVKDGKLVVQDDAFASAFAAPPALESGGGGLVGTAGDYMRFCRMLLNGGSLDGTQLLSPKTVTLMTMNHLPGGVQMTDIMPSTILFNETGYAGLGFGLGVAVTVDVPATRLPGSVGEFAWGGAAGTAFFVDPKEDMAVVFMTQVLGAPERIRLRRELRALVYGAMTESFAKGPGA
jgi:CubicO group peptidase (beta-lactamase class C family)